MFLPENCSTLLLVAAEKEKKKKIFWSNSFLFKGPTAVLVLLYSIISCKTHSRQEKSYQSTCSKAILALSITQPQNNYKACMHFVAVEWFVPRSKKLSLATFISTESLPGCFSFQTWQSLALWHTHTLSREVHLNDVSMPGTVSSLQYFTAIFWCYWQIRTNEFGKRLVSINKEVN